MEQTAKKLEQVKHYSGYDLTKMLIKGGLGKLKLNPNAKQVLLYLTTCYNEKNKVVYPKIKTIAISLGISEIGVKRAIAELIQDGCILKSKHKKNSNEYVITNKVLTLQDDTLQIQDDTSQKYHDDTSHVHEVKQHEVKQHQVKNADVVSINPFKKSAPVSLSDIPDIILNDSHIINKCGYWRSLPNEVKADFRRKQQQADFKQKQLAEYKQQQAKLKEQERQEKLERQAELNKPLNEQWTRKQAIKHVYSLRHFPRFPKHGLAQDLINLYNLDIEQIRQMTPEQIEQLQS